MYYEKRDSEAMTTKDQVKAELEHLSDDELNRLLHLIRTGKLHEEPTGEIRRADGLTDAEFEALIVELDSFSQPAHSLPNEAFSRESIYDDHP